MTPRHGLTVLYSATLILVALTILTGCEDETGPLIRTGTLAGVVRDSAAAYVAGVPVGVVYDMTTPPVAKAAKSAGLGDAAVDAPAAAPATATDDASATAPATAPATVPATAADGLQPLDTIWPVEGLYVERNFPNPFADQTTLRFGVPDSGAVNLSLLGALGDTVATLVDANLAAGLYEFGWSAQSGPALPNGYSLALLRLTVGETERTAYIYGMLHNSADPLARAANDVTDAAGEFTIPLALIASGSNIPLATSAGPVVVGFVRVPDVVRVEIENEGRTDDITVRLFDMSALYYLEFLLP